MFATLNKVTESLSDLYTKQATIMNDQFGMFFKYYKEELTATVDFVKVQEKWSAEFEKKEEKLAQRKENLFSSGRMHLWELSAEDTKGIEPARLAKDKETVLPFMLPRVNAMVLIRLIIGNKRAGRIVCDERILHEQTD